jgi:glutamine cyclotransferase
MEIMFTKYLLVVLSIVMVHSCADQKESNRGEGGKPVSEKRIKKERKKFTELSLKNKKDTLFIGNTLHYSLSAPDSIQIDSVKTYFNSKFQSLHNENYGEIRVSTENLPVGNNTFKIEVFANDSIKESHYQTVKFFSDIQPEQLKARIINVYPHDPNAYTQGLFYENGYLYEGTGKRGRSSLRKVELKTGELINSHALPSEYFGEGIAPINGKIIQLTWTSRTGFVYDKESLKLLNKVKYPTQGWGLTSDGNRLLMSDGTSTIYFLDPEYFNEIKRIKIYDNKGPFKNLNELEYINDKVYANIWQKSYIISFDPETGKVLEKIDCSSLVPEKYKNHNDYVLNGIAYDEVNQNIFLTGKFWSKLYQVEFVKAQ